MVNFERIKLEIISLLMCASIGMITGCSNVDVLQDNIQEEVFSSNNETLIENDNQLAKDIKLGRYLISYNVNFPTEESKKDIGKYYDYLSIVFDEQYFSLIFAEGFAAKGKYERNGNNIICKSEKLFSEYAEAKNIGTEFWF